MIIIEKIHKIIIGALVIRLIVLLIIFVITPKWSIGFYGNTIGQDDVRYEKGAVRFAEIATSLFDYSAFADAYSEYGDYVGFVDNVFSATPLWYWVVCLVYYFFNSIIVIRILNVLLSIIAIALLYKLVKLLYGEDTAITAARLMAYLPYTVVFSCFAYKDTLVMVLTIYLLYRIIDYRTNRKIGIRKIVKIIIDALLLMLIRGGLSAILIVLCLIMLFFSGEKLDYKKVLTRVIFVILASFIAGYIIYYSMDSINLKIQSYITERETTGLGGISLVTISSVKDLYKLPLTFLFAIVMPIGFNGSIISWFNIVALLNICMVPIAVGALIDVFIHKQKELIIIGCLLIYYVISIIASIGIFRHYYSLLFIPIILFSHIKHWGKSMSKNIWYIGSVFYFVILIIYMIK